jgi:ABC-2 type transport system permease protein
MRLSEPDAAVGTRSLARLAIRRERLRLPLWLAGIVLLFAATAQSYTTLYPTHVQRVALARTLGTNAAVTALTGPAFDLLHVGGFTAWRLTSFAVVLVAIMSITCVVRHCRGNEEAGRSELVRAGTVGRGAEVCAAMLVSTASNVLLGSTLAIALCLLGLPVSGSFLLGAAIGGAGLVFGGVAAVTAQLSTTARGATGAAMGVLALSFVLRMVGDREWAVLSWLSPIGWAQRTQAYAGDRWAPLGLAVGTALVTALVAFKTASRRDLGAGMFAPGPRPPTASVLLSSVEGLRVRLERAMLGWWAGGVATYAVVVGFLARDVRGLLDANASISASFRRVARGGVLENGYTVAMAGVLGLIAAGFGVQAVLKLRRDESGLFAEPILGRSVTRRRWFASYVLTGITGSALITLSAGLVAGLADVARRHDVDPLGTWTAACMLQTPAIWVLVGLAAAIVGCAPRVSPVAWIAYGAAAMLGQIGQLLDLPAWVLEASPFDHVPAYPATSVAIAPIVTLAGVGALLTVIGLAGLSRRDIG